MLGHDQGKVIGKLVASGRVKWGRFGEAEGDQGYVFKENNGFAWKLDTRELEEQGVNMDVLTDCVKQLEEMGTIDELKSAHGYRQGQGWLDDGLVVTSRVDPRICCNVAFGSNDVGHDYWNHSINNEDVDLYLSWYLDNHNVTQQMDGSFQEREAEDGELQWAEIARQKLTTEEERVLGIDTSGNFQPMVEAVQSNKQYLSEWAEKKSKNKSVDEADDPDLENQGYSFSDKESQKETLAQFINDQARWRYEYETEHEDAGNNYIDAYWEGFDLDDYARDPDRYTEDVVAVIEAARKAGKSDEEIKDAISNNLDISPGTIERETHGIIHALIGEIADQISGISGKVNGRDTNDVMDDLIKGLSEEDLKDVANNVDDAYWSPGDDYVYMDASYRSWVARVDPDELAVDLGVEVEEESIDEADIYRAEFGKGKEGERAAEVIDYDAGQTGFVREVDGITVKVAVSSSDDLITGVHLEDPNESEVEDGIERARTSGNKFVIIHGDIEDYVSVDEYSILRNRDGKTFNVHHGHGGEGDQVSHGGVPLTVSSIDQAKELIDKDFPMELVKQYQTKAGRSVRGWKPPGTIEHQGFVIFGGDYGETLVTTQKDLQAVLDGKKEPLGTADSADDAKAKIDSGEISREAPEVKKAARPPRPVAAKEPKDIKEPA